MELEQAIQAMEDPSTDRLLFSKGELTKWLKELRDARELIRKQSAAIEGQSRYIEMHIDGRR